MQALTLLVYEADDPFAERTIQVLFDWSAAGWIDGFAAVSVAEVLERGEAIAHEQVVLPPRPDGPAQVRALGRLVEAGGLRIVALDPVGRDATWVRDRQRLHEAANLLYRRVSGRVGALDVLVGWHGGHWDPDLPVWPGWDTIVAAPQESVSPADGGFDLHCDPDQPAQVLAVAGHAAAFVAAVAGLWAGVEASAWDHTDGSDDVRMARAFHMRLDGSAVLEVLQQAALSPESLRAPDTMEARGPTDLPARAAGVVGTLLLEPRPTPSRQPEPEPVAALEALGMLLSFLWQALVDGPRALTQALLGTGRSRTADRLTQAVFGAEATKHVTVGGTAGRAAQTAAIRRATSSEERLEVILRSLSAQGIKPAPVVPPSAQEPFWRNFVNTALALTSGERQRGIEPVVDEGQARWFPMEWIAPATSLTWHPLDGAPLLAGTDEIPVHDVLACADALQELQELAAAELHGQIDVERNRRDLERDAQHWRRSFVGALGVQLGDRISMFRRELGTLVAELSAMSEPPTQEANDLAARLSRFVRIVTGVAATVIAVVGLLTWQDVLGWPLWGWLPAIVATWFLLLVIKYLSIQREIFKLLHRGDQQEARTATLSRELPVVIENLRRLRRVYDQYLVWARLMPAFLADPYGRADVESSTIVRMTGQVPPSVMSGRYRPHDQRGAHTAAARLARSARVPAGDAWDAFVEASYERLGRELPEFASQVPDDAFALDDRRLARWLAEVSQERDGGIRLSDDLAELINQRHLTAVVRASGPGAIRALVDEAFEVVSVEGTPIPTHAPTAAPAGFRSEAFSPDGLSRMLTRPDPDMTRSGSSHVQASHAGPVLDEVGSVLVVTRRLSLSDLALRRARQDDSAPSVPHAPTGQEKPGLVF